MFVTTYRFQGSIDSVVVKANETDLCIEGRVFHIPAVLRAREGDRIKYGIRHDEETGTVKSIAIVPSAFQCVVHSFNELILGSGYRLQEYSRADLKKGGRCRIVIDNEWQLLPDAGSGLRRGETIYKAEQYMKIAEAYVLADKFLMKEPDF